jgi:uncharacterized integral membrane protein
LRARWLRVLYWSAVVLTAIAVSLFAVSNRERVALAFWPLSSVAEAPLFLVVVAALLCGLAIGAAAAWIKGGRRRRELRECRRQNAALARELAATQSRLAPQAGEVLPPDRR